MDLLRRWQVGGRPIAILGHGRSGTSWVGKVVSAARRVLYYFEPLHPDQAGTEGLANWFRYAHPGNDDEALAKAFDPVFAGLPSPAKAWNRNDWHRWLPGYRVAVKEVAALMAAEWLAERYDPQMVFIVRHPCAVILSELRQGTPAERSLAALLAQEELVAAHLRPYVKRLREASGDIEQLAAVWAARHRVVADGLAKHPTWHVVYYEALCADPVGEFKQLFASLGLRWSRAMEAYVAGHSFGHDDGMYATRKISRYQIDKWQGQMRAQDEDRVREMTQSLRIPFYKEQEAWTLSSFLA